MIAIIILNWNGQQLLEKFLPSVVRYSEGYSIYVIDNASTDNSIPFLAENYPQITVISNAGNYGFAKGYNEGLKGIDADIYALVNSDIEVTENWLEPIKDAFNADPGVAVIQPKIRDYKNKEYFEYAGAAGGFIDKYGYPFCRGRLFDVVEKDSGQYDDNCKIFWASGACFFIRKNIFNQLNGFDADFFAHQEEIDLCWRAINNGHTIKYIANSLVYHVGGATLQQGSPQKTFLNFRNSMLMLHKNLPTNKVLVILTARLLLDGLAGIQFIAKGKFANCWAIVRAHFSFYKMLSANRLKQTSQQNSHYHKINSIVFEFYISGKKYYSQLFNNSLSRNN